MPDHDDARHMLDRAERAATAGDLASADELLSGAAQLQEKELGPHHPDLANTLNNLAIVAERAGRPGEAETLYRRAAAIASAAFPADHPMVVASRQNLEDFCRSRGLPVKVPIVIPPPRPDAPKVAQVAKAPELEQGPDAARTPPDVRSGHNGAASAAPSPSVTPSAAQRPEPASHRADVPMPLPAPNLRAGPHFFAWVAGGVVLLVVALLLMWRPGSTSDPSPSAAAPATAAPRPGDTAPPPSAASPASPTPVEQVPRPKAAPRGGEPAAGTNKPLPTSKRSGMGAITLATAQLCGTFSTSGGAWRCTPAGTPVRPGPIVFYTRVRSARNAAVVHRWYRGRTLRQSVRLTTRASAREGYRTYSRQTVSQGDWTVEARTADGTLLHEQKFAVR
jgi:hypothetical protein